MRADEAEAKFKQADELYRGGQYAQALGILDELDGAFPNTRHIMFPRARCLAKLDRADEAVAVCDAILREHGYEKAAQLKERLLKQQHAAVPNADDTDDLTFEALNIGLDEPPQGAFGHAPNVSPKRGGNRGALAIAVAALALVVLGGAGVYLTQFAPADDTGEAETTAGGGSSEAPTASPAGSLPIDSSGPPELVKVEGSASETGVTVNMSVEYAVWTDCGDFDCFKEKYARCEAAAIRMEAMGATVEYQILGMDGGQCRIEMTFVQNPFIEDWSGKTMTCLCDNSMDFIDLTEAINPAAILNGDVECTGPLADAMRAMVE